MRISFGQLAKRDTGQDLIEYAFLIAFIALAVAAVLVLTGDAIVGLFEAINTAITNATP